MDKERKKQLEKAGWTVGSTQDFLELSDDQIRYINNKLNLSKLLKESRTKKGITQEDLANAIGTSQPRVALMESGDSKVTIDKILRALYFLNVSESEISAAFKNEHAANPA